MPKVQPDAEQRLAALEATVRAMEKQLAALRNGTAVAPTEVPKGQCVLGAEIGSCPSPGTYRYQRYGCRGQDCRDATSAYYSEHPRKKGSVNGTAVDVPVAVKKRVLKSASSKK